MTRLGRIVFAVSFGALSLASASANAGMVGATVHPIFYADIPELNADPTLPFDPTKVDDDTIGPIKITNGLSFDFNDYRYGIFGDFMTVTFTDTQITLTNLIPGAYPEYTAASFVFSSFAGSIGSVTVDPASSPLFAPGSVLTFSQNSILLNLSNTCAGVDAAACLGTTATSPGEKIVLNVVTAVPEPSEMALLGVGLLSLVLHRRRASRRGSRETCEL